MKISKQQIKQAVERALDELPAEKMAEVLDFVLFLPGSIGLRKEPEGRLFPSSRP